MGTINLPNFRTTADVTMNTKLKDGGVYIDWASLTEIRAWIYSDAQKAMAGRADVTIDQQDSTKAVLVYAGTKAQYPGINRLIIQARYNGSLKTYDKAVFNFVPRTAEATGNVTIDEPETDVEIVVQDVSSSILDATILAAISAAERADEAAAAAEHMVNIHQGPPGPSGISPIIGQNGNWWTWDDELEQYVDSGNPSRGPRGLTGETPDISIGTVTTAEPGTPAAATMTGTPEAPELNMTIPQGPKGDDGDSAYQVAVDEGFVGTKQEWLDSLNGIGLDSVSTPATPDGTADMHLSDGNTVTLNLNHTHGEYFSKLVGTAQPSGGFLPDVVYNLGEISGTVAFALAAAVTGQLNHYFWMFSTGASAPTVTFPNDITWAGGSAPTISANKNYEISVLNGIAYYSEV